MVASDIATAYTQADAPRAPFRAGIHAVLLLRARHALNACVCAEPNASATLRWARTPRSLSDERARDQRGVTPLKRWRWEEEAGRTAMPFRGSRTRERGPFAAIQQLDRRRLCIRTTGSAQAVQTAQPPSAPLHGAPLVGGRTLIHSGSHAVALASACQASSPCQRAIDPLPAMAGTAQPGAAAPRKPKARTSNVANRRASKLSNHRNIRLVGLSFKDRPRDEQFVRNLGAHYPTDVMEYC